ncbi:YHS domain-containing (seleno)protein [Pedobacter sp. Hv1]|uniref:YHS domain-containing (seleno)protein n=1 Tax=Pedobacter sp. Hv1 TaxID=1740090 RepID=UPI0006D8CF33|nr:YHS domain-containing (seleno)protein [Pedobacter sp. Hv1]KQC00723.1 YHS domain protein [Pedobacter sp. Hv1]
MKILITVAIVTFFTISNVNAQKSQIFAPGGKAIKGYDPVAFFKDSKPVKGEDSLSFNWKDTKWLFANRANLESFKADPTRFEPQYGGYCAYGTSNGYKAPTQTDTWTIVEGKLYFNYNTKVKEMWTKDQQALIKKADEQWPKIIDKP